MRTDVPFWLKGIAPDAPITGESEGRRRWRGLLLFQLLIMFS